MAKSYDNSNANSSNNGNAGSPKKPAPAAKTAPPANSVLAQAQRRAQQTAAKPQTSPTQFLEEAWVELKKTSWPNRDVLTKSTSVVLALVVAVAIWVGGIDAVLTKFQNLLFASGK